MKSLFYSLLAFPAILAILTFSLTTTGQQPAPPQYLIFLHNRWVEGHLPSEPHPTYGRPEYPEILNRFRTDGFIVLSEKRPDNTIEEMYAGKVKIQIDSLLRLGIKPANITIVGTSKGGNIAQRVSNLSKDPNLNYVFIGSSFKDEDSTLKDITLHGRILCITEASDTGNISLSTQTRFKRSKLTDFKEIILHTGLHHGFLFKELDAWIVPTENWARPRP
jgi:hypothetical protein